jgi:hypothetical protein
LLFAVAEQEFADERIEYSDMPALKTFGVSLFDSLEVTNEDGTCSKLGQSMSVARFLANKFIFAGKIEQKKAEVDM